VVLAGVVVASIALPAWQFGFAGHENEQVGKILGAPSAVDRFRDLYGDKPSENDETVPPLVKQAEVFANILNPPTPKRVEVAKTPKRSYTPPPRPIAPSTAKFDLVGTSYSEVDPASSFAYIRMPDKSYQWVRQGDEVGHITIKEIRNGSILCWDGQQDSEMMAEATADTASLLETAGGQTATAAASHARPAALPADSGRDRPTPSAGMVRSTSPQITSRANPNRGEPDHDKLNVLIDRLKQSDMDDASKAAAMSQLISEYKQRFGTGQAEESEESDEQGGGDHDEREASIESRRREFLKRMSTPRSAGY
jgi:hypothetical protein